MSRQTGPDPAYVFGQLQRALAAWTTADDADRTQAEDRIRRWEAVIEGWQAGTLAFGSRTPVQDTPAWITLEVAHGGFATGRLLAEGEVADDERSWVTSMGSPPPVDRAAVARAALSDAGQDRLLDALQTGRYRIELPEEGALPVIAWLLANGHDARALQLLDTLGPWLDRLRFLPRWQPTVQPPASMVHVSTVQQVQGALAQTTPSEPVEAMRAALSTWLPLHDRLIALWCDTVTGALPHLVGEGAERSVEGGWPCARWPEDWGARRSVWLNDHDTALRSAKDLPTRFAHPKSNYARLRQALQRCEHDSSLLSGRDVGWIRRCLANALTRHGTPGSERLAALRAAQRQMATQPRHVDLAEVLAMRLDRLPPSGGLPSLDPLAEPTRSGEHPHVVEAATIPPGLLAKVERALVAPIPELVERGLIPSAEVLARVLPQLTMFDVAADIWDPALRELVARIYAAFRRRRSLLLLDLSQQVQFEELPWIAALSDARTEGSGAKQQRSQSLSRAVMLAFDSFPQTVFPNPLVRELGALSKATKLGLPLVEEVAADIFTGHFTAKWGRAADVASRLLKGSLYARYYDLPAPSASPVRALKQAWGRSVDTEFAQRCRARTREVRTGQGSWVAENGAVLEQSQVLTTHNLAVLVQGLDLQAELSDRAPELAQRVFAWIVERNRRGTSGWHAELHLAKSTAYAWRQALFLLSMCAHATQRRIALEHLNAVSTLGIPWSDRYAPAVTGLLAVLDGTRFDPSGHVRHQSGLVGRRLYGWSVGPHWLAPPR
ncbi:MAG: hypothetical protein KTR31_02150 [Myxococcales bacterium]|nr:hypothetical protein [Myxococcales bacterium]